MYNQTLLNEYQQIGVQSRVNSSNPHSLVAMLFDGLLEKLARANGALERGDASGRGNSISAAIRIIDGLRASLDTARGGDIAANLSAMYDYMERRLVEANSQADGRIIAEVTSLVNEIKEGWDSIPAEYRGA
ncbi:MAG: flagellar export chaperone FliS [Pseudomonadales bacterium]|nr:flagellar export chaperone FliS [Pseudomonadales bacterium]